MNDIYVGTLFSDTYLEHHGILGMKWGKRNGPPYPLGINMHSAAEKAAGWMKSLRDKHKYKNEHWYSREQARNTNSAYRKLREKGHNLNRAEASKNKERIKKNKKEYNEAYKEYDRNRKISQKAILADRGRALSNQGKTKYGQTVKFVATVGAIAVGSAVLQRAVLNSGINYCGRFGYVPVNKIMSDAIYYGAKGAIGVAAAKAYIDNRSFTEYKKFKRYRG